MSDAPKDPSKKRRARAGKLSAFALAAESQSVCAEIDVDDVLHLRPNWTPQQAAAFLENNSEVIGTAMAVRGAEILVAIMGDDQYAN